MAGQAVTLYDFEGNEYTFDNPFTVDINSEGVDVQYPVATDSDSVYVKDIWLDESISTNWVDQSSTGLDPVLIPFTNLHTVIKNETSDNPKELLIHFNRTVSLNQVGLGCVGVGANFSNVKVIVLGSGGVERTVMDDSSNNTKYTSFDYVFGPELGNAIKLQFHTTDTICVSNITIQKVIKVAARMEALKPDGSVTDIDATNGGNLKVSVEELESGISTNSNSQLKTTLYDSDGIELTIDSSTGAVAQESYEHKEIHSGSHYNYCDYSLGEASGAIIEFILVTPNTTKWTHFTFEFSASEGATLEVFEGASGISGGTSITPRNNNRNSINTSVVTITKDPTTITSDGTRAAGFLAGGSRSSGFSSREKENVLKQNETYLLRITSLAVSNDIGWCSEWYEHTNI